MARRALVVLVSIAVAAGAYLLWKTGAAPAPGDAGSTSRAAPEGTAETQRLSGRQDLVQPWRSGGRTIGGRVLRSGAPVAANVEARAMDPLPWYDEAAESDLVRALSFEGLRRERVSQTRASADGRFELRGLTPGAYVLVATDGTDRGTSRVEIREGEPAADVTLDLAPGALQLHGRVLASPERPWAGRLALSPAKWLVFADPDASPLRTDAEGRFVATGLRAGRHLVLAIEPGRARVTAAVTLPHDGEWTLVLAEPDDEISGRVVRDEDEAPVAGASVVSMPFEPERFDVWMTSTAEDGTFRLPRGRRNRGSVRAFAAGFAPASVELADEPLTLRLQRFGRVVGTVSEEATGRRVAGLVLRAGDREATTDAEGAYVLDRLAPKNVELRVVSSEWIVEGPDGPQVEGLRVEPDGGRDLVVGLVVSRGASIRGVVRDAAGRPAVGAIVTGTATSDPDSRGVEAVTAVTDGQGRFTLVPLVPGEDYALAARARDATGPRAGPFRARPGGAPDVEMRLHPSRYVAVRVFETGTQVPVADANVDGMEEAREDERSTQAFFPLSATTDAAGIARLGPCPPGRLRVGAQAAEFVSVAAGAPLVVEAGGTTLDVALERSLSIEGRVVAAEGPPPRGNVQAYGPATESETGFFAGMARIEETGAFRLADLRPGRYLLSVDTVEGVRIAAQAGDRGVIVSVPPRAASSAAAQRAPDPSRELRVRVLGSDGSAADSAQLGLRVRGSIRFGRASKGVATFWAEPEDLAGTTIEVWDARDAAGRPLGWAPTRAGPIAGTAAEIELRMPPGRVVEGRVVDAGGTGVPRCRVYAILPDPDGSSIRATTRTRADGSFSLTGLGEGRHGLVIEAPSEYLVPGPVPVTAGDRDVRVQLVKGTRPSAQRTSR